jgi:hypothetical protein
MKNKKPVAMTGFSFTPSPNSSAFHPTFFPQGFFLLASFAPRPIA